MLQQLHDPRLSTLCLIGVFFVSQSLYLLMWKPKHQLKSATKNKLESTSEAALSSTEITLDEAG